MMGISERQERDLSILDEKTRFSSVDSRNIARFPTFAKFAPRFWTLSHMPPETAAVPIPKGQRRFSAPVTHELNPHLFGQAF